MHRPVHIVQILLFTALCAAPRSSVAIIAGSTVKGQNEVPSTLAFLLETLSAYAEDAVPRSKRSTWWLRIGHIGQVPLEIVAFSKLGVGAKTICEIGFNAGHSAAALLAGNDEATYYAFDAMSLPYSMRSMALFRRHFGQRFQAIKGWSYSTVPWFKQQNITCDVFSVDGDHNYDGALTDLLNAIDVMEVGGLVIADDVTDRFAGCKKAFNDMVAHGYLRDPVCEDAGMPDEEAKGWCYAYVASKTGPLSRKHEPSTTNLRFEAFDEGSTLQLSVPGWHIIYHPLLLGASLAFIIALVYWYVFREGQLLKLCKLCKEKQTIDGKPIGGACCAFANGGARQAIV